MEYTLEELLQEREWRRIAPDWNTSTPDELLEAFRLLLPDLLVHPPPERGRILFELFDAQVETIEM